MCEAYDLVREQTKTIALRRKLKHDFDGNFPKFEVGDSVWYFYPRKYSGLNQEWRLLWDGPYTIVDRPYESIYKIKHCDRKFTVVTNAHKLKRC